LLVLAVVLFHYYLHSKVEDYRKEMVAAGEKLEILEVAPQFNSEGNAFDLVVEAHSAIRSMPADSQLAPRWIGEGVAELVHKRELINDRTNPQAAPTNHWPALEKWSTENAAGIQLLHNVLTQQHLAYRVDYARGFHAVLPHLQPFRLVAKSLWADTYVALREGDSNRVFTNLLAGAHLVDIYNNEPILISQFVRMAVGQIIWNSTWEAVESGVLNESQLTALQEKWSQINFFAPLPNTFRMERAMMLDALREMRFSRARMNQMVGATPRKTELLDQLIATGSEISSDPIGSMKNLVLGVAYYPAFKYFGSYYEELRIMELSLSSLKQLEEAIATREVKEWVIVPKFPSQNFPGPVSAGTMSGWINRSQEQALNMQTRTECLIGAIAAYRYKLAHGAFPTNLAQAVPEFAPRLPWDWALGKPLSYSLTEDGRFRLHGLGWDKKEQGPEKLPVARKSYIERDPSWPRPATQEELKAFDRASTSSAPARNLK
jgi:hypothetical protein